MQLKIKPSIYAYIVTVILGTLFKTVVITATGIVLWFASVPQFASNLSLDVIRNKVFDSSPQSTLAMPNA